jgi:DNA processing protein
VPGRIDQPTSAGCHQLIRDGATLLTRLEDILEELAYVDGLNPQSIATRAARREDDSPALTEAERRVWDRFRGGEVLTADALAADLGLPAAAVAAALLKLELGRRIARRLDGAYEGGPG